MKLECNWEYRASKTTTEPTLRDCMHFNTIVLLGKYYMATPPPCMHTLGA